MGRWRDGTPLELSPAAPQPGWAREARGARLNDFLYASDADGHRCPVGAHVRRANPRDALGWGAKLTRRHRIIRRGMPYGRPLPDGAPDDAADRGLMFVCHQASISRQFEVIQGLWLADGDALGLGDDGDPVMGSTPTAGRAPAKLTIQGDPPRFVGPLRRFVTVRGASTCSRRDWQRCGCWPTASRTLDEAGLPRVRGHRLGDVLEPQRAALDEVEVLELRRGRAGARAGERLALSGGRAQPRRPR